MSAAFHSVSARGLLAVLALAVAVLAATVGHPAEAYRLPISEIRGTVVSVAVKPKPTDKACMRYDRSPACLDVLQVVMKVRVDEIIRNDHERFLRLDGIIDIAYDRYARALPQTATALDRPHFKAGDTAVFLITGYGTSYLWRRPATRR